MRVAAIVVAAGAGERFGARKQFAPLGDSTPAALAVTAARSVAELVVLVAPGDVADDAHGADAVTAGGSTRSCSVRARLAVVPPEFDVIVVHDAARPLATPMLFGSVLDALADETVAGVVPGLAVADTLKRVDDQGAVVATVDRERLYGVQTPQGFRAAWLRRAHDAGLDATDDAALVEAIGGRVVVVAGELDNRKVTTPEDLEAARAVLEAR